MTTMGAATPSPAIDEAVSAGSNSVMRADLIIAIVLAVLCFFLAVAGFFLWDWSLILVCLFAAAFVAADGYFLYGVFQMAKENQAKKAP